MEETKDPEMVSADKQFENGEDELSHSDKFVGILTSPGKTFESMSKYPPRLIDWLLPVVVTVLFAIISNFIVMSNPNIKNDLLEKQISGATAMIEKQVSSGALSREAADEQIDKIREQMEMAQGIGGRIITAISTVFGIFIIFFIVSGVYYFFSKTVLHGDGNFAAAMIGNGLPYYISIISIILMTIISMLTDRFVAGTSLAAIMNSDTKTFLGFLLKKADIITIWSLAVTGIGLAKMFHSKDTKKYLITVFSIWIVWGLITFFIAKAVPFLGNFA
ncbi:MAG: YIP1 family protein [Syntrophothermus sp.]